MSAFKLIRDISNNFDAELRQTANELFCAKIGESFEEDVEKKLQDLALFTSKLRLLRAKPIAGNPQITEQVRNEQTTIQEFEDTVTNKVLEQHIVKFLTQSHAVNKLVTTPERQLHPELIERKEKIIKALSDYRTQESELRQLQELLSEKETELAEVRQIWDKELGDLRDMRDNVDKDGMIVEPGQYHQKLKKLVDKMELMRWLMNKLVTSRTGRYDWLSDPEQRLKVLTIARQDCTIEKLLEE